MTATLLNADDLLLGSQALHNVTIPAAILTPVAHNSESQTGYVQMRPLNIAVLTLISRAARDDASLLPLLMIKEAVVEPALTLDQIRQMHVDLVHFLVSQINRISGLDADGATLNEAAGSPLGQTHILLAKHFGWTPEQVNQLTPGQVAVYLAGVEKLLQLELSGTGA
ncbi:hypothetical protein KFU94_48765 [Chloroflexi bacterium TSY]|nr:hypothetical protein [Chloroflexi bacterium TSY]